MLRLLTPNTALYFQNGTKSLVELQRIKIYILKYVNNYKQRLVIE